MEKSCPNLTIVIPILSFQKVSPGKALKMEAAGIFFPVFYSDRYLLKLWTFLPVTVGKGVVKFNVMSSVKTKTFPPTCLLLTPLLLIQLAGYGQNTDTLKETRLEEVVVRAFEQNRKLKDIPAAVNYVGPSTLELYSPSSIVMAVNATPGIHMEERSPGSYRFNIRGSSLRSPFGVRNVKVYFNDLPITDPGGNTYLNQLGYYNFHSLEVIKGPGSSVYGAGTGGVLLIESMDESEKPSLMAEYGTGSYGLQNLYGAVTTGSQGTTNKIGFQHQQSDGYRDHAALNRNVLTWNGSFHFSEKQHLKTTFLYGDLYYQTPGALTLAEFTAHPQAARPAAGGFPSAEQSRAAITQKTFIAGASYRQQLGSQWENQTTAYGMFTELRNPGIRNYGKNSEPHTGGRSSFRFHQDLTNGAFNWDIGGEWQQGFTSVSVHKNVAGNPDSLQTYDEISNRQYFVFSQAVVELRKWSLTAGASWNKLRISLQRFQPASLGRQTRDFDNQLAPRVVLSRKLKQLTLYSSLSRGFSPPTTEELTPSGSAINLGLNAEQGLNYDAGIKGSFRNGLYADVNAFLFSLNNTIVTRKDAGGGDYYINAGKTKQYGVETYLAYPFLSSAPYFRRSLFWISHTWHHFHYRDFKQLSNDFSGKQLPGEPPHTVSTGIDVSAKNGWLGNIAYYFSDRIPLNDANTAYANAYHLLSAKLGYEKANKESLRWKLVAGVENLLDQRYSLGNDINGFGGRYYNAAPGRNYYVSLILQWLYQKHP